MNYFIIDDLDYSKYVNEMNISEEIKYTAQTNAAGNTVVDYINKKRNIEVGIIPTDNNSMIDILSAVGAFNVSLTFLNPTTGILEEKVNCIIPSNNIEYYTIQKDKVLFKALKLKFIEL